MIDKQKKIEAARDLFLSGWNCAQAVAGAFAEEMGMDQKTALKMSSGFGGGMGGTRNVCGAVSGMCMVASQVLGDYDADDNEAKKYLYAAIQRMYAAFTQQHETISCLELLRRNGILAKAEPSERTPEYYRTRPCVRYVEACASLVADMLNEEGK